MVMMLTRFDSGIGQLADAVRILWIKSELLHPVDKGGRIRTFQMLRSLSRNHRVTYLCLDDGEAAADAKELALEYASEVVTVPFNPPKKGSLRFYAALFVNLFSRSPYALSRYRSQSLRAHISRLSTAADLVVCDFLAPAENVPDQLNATAILFQHNVEATIWERHFIAARNPLKRAYMWLQWRRMVNSERAHCRRFDHVIAVSDIDARTMTAAYGLGSVSSVTTGVDLGFFRRSPPINHGGSDIVFVGSMDWMPNDDGVRWFAADIFPRIRMAQPNARLVVVGRSPSASLRELALRNPMIEVTGTVSDVRPYLQEAALCIVPLRIGGGTRLKIYESMAMGVPVVSTTIGAEGLPLRNGVHLLLADSAHEFADAVVSLLKNPSLRDKLALAAARHVETSCGWDSVADEFLQQCEAQSARRNSGSD